MGNIYYKMGGCFFYGFKCSICTGDFMFVGNRMSRTNRSMLCTFQVVTGSKNCHQPFLARKGASFLFPECFPSRWEILKLLPQVFYLVSYYCWNLFNWICILTCLSTRSFLSTRHFDFFVLNFMRVWVILCSSDNRTYLACICVVVVTDRQ